MHGYWDNPDQMCKNFKYLKTFKGSKTDIFENFQIQSTTLFSGVFSSLWLRMKAKDFSFRLLPIFWHSYQKCGHSDLLKRPITIQYHLFEMKYLSLPLVAKIQKMVWVVVFVTKGTHTWNSVGSLVFCLYMVAVI